MRGGEGLVASRSVDEEKRKGMCREREDEPFCLMSCNPSVGSFVK